MDDEQRHEEPQNDWIVITLAIMFLVLIGVAILLFNAAL